MNRLKNTTVLIMFFCIELFGKTPHLSGNITFSIKEGVIKCDFVLSDIPSINNYSIRINSGFNIALIGDSTLKTKYEFNKDYNSESDEAFQYYITDKSGKKRHLPKTLRFIYTGAFPVISDTAEMYNSRDWKGNIAFNGSTLRMTEQSAWYPVLYNADKDEVIDKYTYSIDVKCSDCSSEYVNGDVPKAGGTNNFNSNKPVSMLLFAGNYKFEKREGIYFINTGLSEKESGLLAKWSNNIIKYYSDKFNIPYGSSIFYLGAVPVAKRKAWLFVTYPTIALVGRTYTYNIFFNDKNGLSIDTSQIHFIAHEMGHYYFGTLFKPNAELKWVFLEGLTEFASLQFVKDNLGTNTYRAIISSYIKELSKKENYQALNKIKESGSVSELYRYRYVPLLITALEKKTGEKKIWDWLAFVVKSKNVKTDYSFFESSLLKSGIPQATLDWFVKRYVNSDDRLQNLINDLSPISKE